MIYNEPSGIFQVKFEDTKEVKAVNRRTANTTMNKRTDNGLQTQHRILQIERHWKLGMETMFSERESSTCFTRWTCYVTHIKIQLKVFSSLSSYSEQDDNKSYWQIKLGSKLIIVFLLRPPSFLYWNVCIKNKESE